MDSPIAVVEPDGAVVVLRRTEGGWARTQLASHGFWPAWSPSASNIAISALDTNSNAVTSTVELFEPTGRHQGTLFRQIPGAPPAIGPRIPGYALWSPTGDTLSYVAPASNGLTLFSASPTNPGVQIPLLSGAPIFSTWSPDGSMLAVHAGDRVTLLHPALGAPPITLPGNAIGFRTPACSSASTLVYAIAEAGAVSLHRTNFAGDAPTHIAGFPGGVAFAFRPGTETLYVAMTRAPDTGLFDELSAVDVDRPTAPRRITRGPFAAFLWSPTGDRLLLVTPTQSGDGRFALEARSPDGSLDGVTEGFVPSADLRTYLNFFDQFALSHRLWSPDGESFLIAGRIAGDAVHGTFGDPIGNLLMRWHPGRGQPLELVAPGEIGLFPPRGAAVR